jgi:muramidase (phage lysozyme)
MAVYRLDKRHILEPLLRGDLDAVLPEASKEWASLPQGPGQRGYYPDQPYKSYDDVKSIFDLNRSP